MKIDVFLLIFTGTDHFFLFKERNIVKYHLHVHISIFVIKY